MAALKIVFWHWWALAAVLLVCEMLLPGVVFMFLACGAVVAGLVLLVAAGTSIELQLVVFAIVSVASAVALRPLLRRLQVAGTGGGGSLNARGDSMVGKTLVLDQPILAGRGRAKIGDGSWTVVGPDMAAGARVRVVAVNGNEVTVAPSP